MDLSRLLFWRKKRVTPEPPRCIRCRRYVVDAWRTYADGTVKHIDCASKK